MIPILFESTAKSFDNYGIGVLRDTTSCEITEERNGSYELTLKYPINGALYGYIKKERIIVAKPNDLVLTLGAGTVTEIGPKIIN